MTAHAAHPRHLAGKGETERVDGHDAEARWVIEQAPVEGRVAVERGAGELPSALGVGFRGLFAQGILESAADAAAHFAGSLAGEGDGDDGLGCFDGGEEREEALGEEFGFTGAGGSLDEEGLGDIEGAFADCGVGRRHLG